jgi:hypothetical protein
MIQCVVLMLPMQCTPVQSVILLGTEAVLELLQLPDTALSLVLQKLDQCSLACAAVTCSKLRHAVPAHISKLEVQCRTSEGCSSMFRMLEQHSTSLTSLKLCHFWSCDAGDCWDHGLTLQKLSCPQLRQLSLDGVDWQLEPAGSCPGLLHYCTALAALDASKFGVESIPAATVALAELTDLRSLQLTLGGDRLLLDLQQSTQLTYLSLNWRGGLRAEDAVKLIQLSGLVNLQHLKLSQLPCHGVSGGVPSQLTKLTRLHLAYRERQYNDNEDPDFAAQFKALSTFTALRELYVSNDDYQPAEALSGSEHLSLLTSLELRIPNMKFSSKHSWVRSLTELEELRLKECEVHADVLARYTQLRSLSVETYSFGDSTRFTAVFDAVSQLVQLTELRVTTTGHLERFRTPPAAAYTALAASTNLCRLQLNFYRDNAAPNWALFRPGSPTYPHLRVVRLTFDNKSVSSGEPFSEQQLQQLCRCCPAVQDLLFVLPAQPSPTALLPLLQLSALTSLGVHNVDAEGVCVVAQLKGLRSLELRDVSQLASASVLSLTALTALEGLRTWNVNNMPLFLRTKVSTWPGMFWCRSGSVLSACRQHDRYCLLSLLDSTQQCGTLCVHQSHCDIISKSTPCHDVTRLS